MNGWYVLFTTAKVSRDIRMKVNSEVVRGLQRNDIRELLVAQGAEPFPGSVDEIEAFVRAEQVKWGKVVAALGLKVD